jgi:LL-diaminopimelate aminotransferase
MSGVTRNPNFAKLAGGYLFPEIGRRRNAYLAANPDMASRIISLGIGDTTLPIPEHILGGLVTSASKLGTKEGYSGYGAEQGMGPLRAKIADKLYGGLIKDSEVFVSDGAKCDIMRIQQVFGSDVTTAVQVSKRLIYSYQILIPHTFAILFTSLHLLSFDQLLCTQYHVRTLLIQSMLTHL